MYKVRLCDDCYHRNKCRKREAYRSCNYHISTSPKKRKVLRLKVGRGIINVLVLREG